MAMSIDEAHKLFSSPGLSYSISAWIRSDVVGHIVNGAGITDATTTLVQLSTTPAGYSAASYTSNGDILQVADEDMLVTAEDKTFGLVYVKRQFANTTYQGQGYPYFTAAWTWKDFTDRIDSNHGIDALSTIRRSFERKMNNYESSVANVRALNTDRFWDSVVPPLGVSSYRARWIRFYLHTRRGSLEVDVRRLCTMLIDDVSTDDGPYATLKLKGIGSLLQQDTDASDAKAGREWFAYTPTSLLVEALLNKTDYGRTGGSQIEAGIPIHIKRHLTQKAYRTIPVDEATVSHWGRVGAIRRPSPYTGGTQDWLMPDLLRPSTPNIAGAFVSAMEWDPQVTGPGNVYTGDPSTVGRLYLGIGSDLWEFDPRTGDARPVLQNLMGVGRRIRRLWYNSLDTALAGQPHILGAAWPDYPTAVPASDAYSYRIVSGLLFRWNGGFGLTSSTQIDRMFPGTHCFRKGQVSSLGGGTAGAPSWGENIAVPFSETLGARIQNTAKLMGSITGRDGDADTAGNALPYRTATLGPSETYAFAPGVVSEAVDVNGDAIALNKSYFALTFAAPSGANGGHNYRFTLGQHGACEYLGDPAGVQAWCDQGAIAYCEMDIVTGIITVKAWEPSSGTTTTLKTMAADYEQPISMAGNLGLTSAGPALFLGYMEWSETGASVAWIRQFSLAAVESAVYDGTTDAGAGGSTYYSPTWMACVPRLSTAAHLVVTWFKRDRVGETNMFGHKAYQTFPFTNASPAYLSVSMLHAVTHERGAINSARALDTAGRFVQLDIDPATSIITTTVLDRGFAPVDGEPWSACNKLAKGESSAGVSTWYGCSSPAWPFGYDIRDGKRDGQYVLWKHDKNMWDSYEIGYFEGETIEEALAHLAFGSLSVWGFDWDGGGNFRFDDRVQSGTAVVQFGGGSDRITKVARRRSYDEIENPVELQPWVLRSGEISARVDLTSSSTISSASEPIDVQSPDNKKKMIVLTCVQGGRVGVAKFKAYVEAGTYKTITTQTYPAMVPVSQVEVLFGGLSAAGPWNEWTNADRNRQLQIPAYSVVTLPDNTKIGLGFAVIEVGFVLYLSLSSPWTPQATAYAGSPISIDLEIASRASDYSVSPSNPNGGYVLTSDFGWQEIGAGQPWATGVLVKFRQAYDRRKNTGAGSEVGYGEAVWSFGDRIVIDVPGLEASANGSAKVRAFDAVGISKYGTKALRTNSGKLSPRRALRIANARLAQNKYPRWVYTVTTFFAPHIRLFDRVRVYSPKLIRTSPYWEDTTVRKIEHDLRAGQTVLECVGGFIDAP